MALSFGEVDLCDHEACEFIFYSVVSLLMGALMRWSRCCRPRGSLVLQCSLSSGIDLVDPEAQICFLQWVTLLTSGLWAFNVLADYTLKFFVLFTRVCHFPVEKSSASKVVEVRPEQSRPGQGRPDQSRPGRGRPECLPFWPPNCFLPAD